MDFKRGIYALNEEDDGRWLFAGLRHKIPDYPVGVILIGGGDIARRAYKGWLLDGLGGENNVNVSHIGDYVELKEFSMCERYRDYELVTMQGGCGTDYQKIAQKLRQQSCQQIVLVWLRLDLATIRARDASIEYADLRHLDKRIKSVLKIKADNDSPPAKLPTGVDYFIQISYT